MSRFGRRMQRKDAPFSAPMRIHTNEEGDPDLCGCGWEAVTKIIVETEAKGFPRNHVVAVVFDVATPWGRRLLSEWNPRDIALRQKSGVSMVTVGREDFMRDRSRPEHHQEMMAQSVLVALCHEHGFRVTTPPVEPPPFCGHHHARPS